MRRAPRMLGLDIVMVADARRAHARRAMRISCRRSALRSRTPVPPRASRRAIWLLTTRCAS